MKKLVASKVKSMAKTNAEKCTLLYNLDFDEHVYFERPEQEWSSDERVLLSGDVNRFTLKYQFIYHCIYTNSFNRSKADTYGVTEEDVHVTFRKLVAYLKEIEKFEEMDEFLNYLFEETKNVYEIEKSEYDEIYNGKLLDRLCHREKYFTTLKIELNDARIKVRDYEFQIDRYLNQLRRREISGTEYETLTSKFLDNSDYWKYRFIDLKDKVKKMGSTSKQKRRSALKKCIPPRILNGLIPLNKQTFAPMSVGICEFVIDEYCRWYNNKYKPEIKAYQKHNKNTALRLKREANSSASQKRKIRMKVLVDYVESTLSIRKIAELTQIPLATVQRYMVLLRSGATQN
ncbi:MAG: hypothetical protein R2799_02930 [Crocinitomicaceae bacterium]